MTRYRLRLESTARLPGLDLAQDEPHGRQRIDIGGLKMSKIPRVAGDGHFAVKPELVALRTPSLQQRISYTAATEFVLEGWQRIGHLAVRSGVGSHAMVGNQGSRSATQRCRMRASGNYAVGRAGVAFVRTALREACGDDPTLLRQSGR